MSDLPTRSDVELAPTMETQDWTEVDIERVCGVIDAYADRTLMTREEFINRFNIDMESCAQAFSEIAPTWYAVMPWKTVEVLMHGILDAALKEDRT